MKKVPSEVKEKGNLLSLILPLGFFRQRNVGVINSPDIEIMGCTVYECVLVLCDFILDNVACSPLNERVRFECISNWISD